MLKSNSKKEHYGSSPMFNPTNDRYKAVGAWFLGAKAENKELFQECVQQSVIQHADHRKNLYEGDPEYIDENIKESLEYKQEVEKIKKFQKELQEKLQLSVPFFSNRYQGHMNWDTVLPANIGYITAMLYNQNNVATEASSVTSLLEKEVGNQLCEMIGYEETNSWGHITADGTIANIEAMWASRNLKFYPLALVDAIKKTKKLREAENILLTIYDDHGKKHYKNLGECSSWQLLNLDCNEILSLREKIKNICRVEEKFLYKVISPYLVENVGLADFLKTHSINSPKIIVPATKHYSWPKAATLLGIGQNKVINVEVDDKCRMDTLKLQAQLRVCAAEKTPILMVVAVIGTTEEGAIDDLESIINLKSFQGLNFTVHCDAAWGGYLKTMMIGSPQRDLSLQESYVKSLPLSAYAIKQFQCLSQADTITIDPHKAGFIPYPAGSLCYKNNLLRYLININASYIHSSDNIAMGMFGLEGSKPGAAAAAVWLAHKTIPLNISGYGQILGECNFTTKLYYCYWLTLATSDDDFIIEPLIPLPKKISLPSGKSLELEANILGYIRSDIIDKTNEQLSQNPDSISFLQQIGSDALINAFVVNYRKNGVLNKSLNNINDFNKKLFSKFSITGSDDNISVKDKKLIITSTELESKNYFIPLKRISEKLELLNISKDFSMQVIINTILQPWPTTHNFINQIMNCFKEGIKSCIEEMPVYLDDSVVRIPIDHSEEPSEWIELKNSYAGYAEIGYDLCLMKELENNTPRPNKIYLKYENTQLFNNYSLLPVSDQTKFDINTLEETKIYLKQDNDKKIKYIFKFKDPGTANKFDLQEGYVDIDIENVPSLTDKILKNKKSEILKKISEDYTSFKYKVFYPDYYELCLMSELSDRNNPESKKIYLEKMDKPNKLKYIFKDLKNVKKEGYIVIDKKYNMVQGELTTEVLNNIRLDILQIMLRERCISPNVKGNFIFKAPKDINKQFLTENKEKILQKILEKGSLPENYYKNQLFYWFFESKYTPEENTPIIIWLNGGPGASSLAGLFLENGPFSLKSNAVVLNNFSWHENAHMLFWDQPLGTGFSKCFDEQYVKSEDELSIQFVNALENFYKKHPKYSKNPLYITGESYAGKYIPYIALEIKNRNRFYENDNINLQGLAIGNGWMNPGNQIRVQIDYAYFLGIIDIAQKIALLDQYQQLQAQIANQNMENAYKIAQDLSNNILKCGGRENFYDIRAWKEASLDELKKYLSSNHVKKSLHVDTSVEWAFSDAAGPVAEHLKKDIMSPSVVNVIKDLVESYKVLFYVGTFDMSCGFAGTEEMLHNMEWSGKSGWLKVNRKIWYNEEQGWQKTLGCIKQFGNLTQIEIPMSGHLVPTYQPNTSRMMIYNWLNINGYDFKTKEVYTTSNNPQNIISFMFNKDQARTISTTDSSSFQVLPLLMHRSLFISRDNEYEEGSGMEEDESVTSRPTPFG